MPRADRDPKRYGMMATMLKGLAFRGFRSFPSSKLAVLAPLSQVNLIVGKNNSGKSNILRVLYRELGRGEGADFDRPQTDSTYEPVVLFGREHGLPNAPMRQGLNQGTLRQLESFLNHPSISRGFAGVLWTDKSNSPLLDQGSPAEASDLVRSMTQSWSSDNRTNARSLVGLLLQQVPDLPRVVYVDGSRAISKNNDDAPDLNGLSIKRRLLELQNPTTARLADRRRFLAIQEFVRTVLDDPGITIDVPHDLSTIHVTQHGRTLPIENLGTGVHEVVILAAAATVVTESVMCIEEPEVHMHPLLQRQLLRYLATRTDNQYFIATHSAHLLDSAIGSIFHVRHERDALSSVQLAGTSEEHAAIAIELGYRPSDLVQSNAVIWVEGPSDRIYIKCWIEKLAPGRFIEGLHYSIMFYGGSLLSQLSPLDQDEVDEFISLRRLNRHMAVVIDSDRTSRRSKLNDTKIRVKEALEGNPDSSAVWVTAGYTIENYVPEPLLNEAIREAHPRSSARTPNLAPMERYANPLTLERTGIPQPSKVAIAKLVAQRWGDEWPLGLKQKVSALIHLIESANSHI